MASRSASGPRDKRRADETAFDASWATEDPTGEMSADELVSPVGTTSVTKKPKMVSSGSKKAETRREMETKVALLESQLVELRSQMETLTQSQVLALSDLSESRMKEDAAIVFQKSVQSTLNFDELVEAGDPCEVGLSDADKAARKMSDDFDRTTLRLSQETMSAVAARVAVLLEAVKSFVARHNMVPSNIPYYLGDSLAEDLAMYSEDSEGYRCKVADGTHVWLAFLQYFLQQNGCSLDSVSRRETYIIPMTQKPRVLGLARLWHQQLRGQLMKVSESEMRRGSAKRTVVELYLSAFPEAMRRYLPSMDSVATYDDVLKEAIAAISRHWDEMILASNEEAAKATGRGSGGASRTTVSATGTRVPHGGAGGGGKSAGCYSCGQHGHIKRDCPKEKTAAAAAVTEKKVSIGSVVKGSATQQQQKDTAKPKASKPKVVDDTTAGAAATKTTTAGKPCKFFAAGHCKFADKCKYKHES